MFRFRFGLILCLLIVVFVKAEELPSSTLLKIPMRDGKTLTADLYLPSKESRGLPCILVRSPAGRQNPYALMHLKLLKEGYAVVIQETRSFADEEGKTLPYISDGWGDQRDGYDTVDWLAKSPYTNGKIGTVGASALGITQLMMGPTRPPGLAAQYISFATSDVFNHGLYQGGELYKHQVEEWLRLYARHPDVYKTIYSQPEYNEFWTKLNMLPLVERCCTPALHVGGWYDVFLQGTLDAYVALQERGGDGAKGQQKLVVGPWIHLWPFITSFGDFNYPANVDHPPFDFSPERWFREHLKEEKKEPLPNVLYYVMGPFDGTPSTGNRWKIAESWPIPHTSGALYLSADRSLLPSPKNIKEGTLAYAYDPNDPVPTIGGKNLFLPSGPMDQRPIESRPDLQIFTSAPLKKDLEITGQLYAELYVTSDQEDSSFSVRLTDVYPDGKSILLSDGITRLSAARKYSPSSKPPYKITVDLGATSFVFAKGHRIRIIVSSSNYPRFEKNLNSLKRPYETNHAVVAENKLHLSKDQPSRLILPIILPGKK